MTVYFISYSRLPDGDASAVRVLCLAKLFRSCNFDVMLIGMGNSDYGQPQEYEGVSYVSLRLERKNIIKKLQNYFCFKKRLKRLLGQEGNIDAIVVTNIPINALNYVKKVAKKNKVKLFTDCCEWYSPEQFKQGRLSLAYFVNHYFVSRFVDGYVYPIAISKYLASYFSQKGYYTINIPAILDVENTCRHKAEKSDKLILMYAGSMGKKDYLDIMLTGLSSLKQEDLSKVEFRIFGVNLNEIKDNFGIKGIDKVLDCIRCYGRVSRDKVLKNLENADFTVLVRSPKQRYAKAGFPTKVVESLATATPVICNLTSDLEDYIKDGYNGIVVKSDRAEDFGEAVKKALRLTVQQKEEMSCNARLTAEEKFDYRCYKDEILKSMRNK